jgi:DNA sulfur modification protein DndD
MSKRLEGSIGAKGLQIKQQAERVSEARRLLYAEIEKDKKYNGVLQVSRFCDRAATVARTVMNAIMRDTRKEIQEKTQEYFLSLIWKREEYKSVGIDDEYNFSVVHRSDRESLGTLSAGEQQVLALSFVSALTSVSGFNAPLIIDTPLARISGEPRQAIATHLPSYLSGRQLILLVTAEEYTNSVRSAMKPAVGTEWRIDYVESPSGSEAKVVPYGA